MKDISLRLDSSRYFKATTQKRTLVIFLLLCGCLQLFYYASRTRISPEVAASRAAILQQCQYIKSPAGPPSDFDFRTQSDRHVPGTNPLWLKNARIWTAARNGTEIFFGDILLENGLIKAVGYIPPRLLKHPKLEVHNMQGAWITPGLVDLHSHLGVYAAPELRGNSDGNSYAGPILPWLRSLDGLNTHDDAYGLAMAGGVTSAQILPGSADNIGGQAYVIKLRPTTEGSATSKVVEPPHDLNGSHFDHSLTPRWRHMKHACGENPSGAYAQTRMDSAWAFRKAYDEGRKIKETQDTFCAKAEEGAWGGLGKFPENLQWESIVDVLRGKVKLSIHCYEAVDLDMIVRLSNEFKFPVASFHHAGQTYLVPDLLKKTWGGVPTVALFATNARKKREAYRNSEFAPRLLADQGIPIVMKSDHPVVNSRYLLNEAALAHYYGLNAGLALASVTSMPAAALGLGHRLGSIREGYDADIVVWDSHPLALGATPQQVYVDGIPQLHNPAVSLKPHTSQSLPTPPNFDAEAVAVVRYSGLPPLEPRKLNRRGPVMFTNVNSVFSRMGDGAITHRDHAGVTAEWESVVVHDGEVVCSGSGSSCRGLSGDDDNAEVIDLQGGSLVPGLIAYGSPLGLLEMRLEPSTTDGIVPNPLDVNSASILGAHPLIRAVDGLQFGGRNTLLAYRGGVTTAVTAPVGRFVLGMSTAFAVGAANVLERGALVHPEVALHVSIKRGSASVSTQIAVLRRMLLGVDSGASHTDVMYMQLRKGTTLVVNVENADIMATLLALKAEYETTSGRVLRLTFSGAAEAHLLAEEIAAAGVSVILSPARAYPETWDQRRILPGPPLSHESAATKLMKAGVNVAIGVIHEYAARNLRFDVAWAALESHGYISKVQAIALATSNLERALGMDIYSRQDIVAYRGGDLFDLSSKPVAVMSADRGVVELFE